VYGSGGGNGDLIPHPRESLVQYLPPELAADEKTQKALAARAAGKAAQIADVLNAILPPKYVESLQCVYVHVRSATNSFCLFVKGVPR
jgi:hypothetical protein